MSSTTNRPPQAHDIEEALHRFEIPPTRAAVAALHLATPVSTICGIDAHIRDRHYTWRGNSVPAGFGAGANARKACELAAAGWGAGDVPVDHSGSCLKVLRSGAHNLVAGGFLYGKGEILCGIEIQNPEKVAEHWLTLGDWGKTGVIELDGEAYLIGGDERVAIIHGMLRAGGGDFDGGGGTYSDLTDDGEVGEMIQRMLDLENIEAYSIGSRLPGTTDIDYVGYLRDGGVEYCVIIPCTIGAGLSVGAPSGAAAPRTIDWYKSRGEDVAWYGVDGYSPLEPARLEPGWVARHKASQISVIIRPS